MVEENKICREPNTQYREQKPSCCQKADDKKEPKGFFSGLLYGLLPHTGCIAFIIFTVLGVTTATALFKPLLLSRYFFYLLILLSFVFATISAIIYLKRCQLLSFEGMKKKWKYLSVLYGTSIGVNLILFLFIFPLAANLTTAAPTGATVASSLSTVTLQVDIPCPGHAPLISSDLKTIQGVQSVTFRFPNYFDVGYDSTKTSQEEILSLDVFKTYPATKSGGDAEAKQTANVAGGCSVCGGCNGACGGACRARI